MSSAFPSRSAGTGPTPAIPNAASAADVVVRGSGIVGCSLALALSRQGLRVQLQSLPVPPFSAAMGGADVRTYALNAASVALLRELRVWDALPPDAACPVQEMAIQGDAAGPTLTELVRAGMAATPRFGRGAPPSETSAPAGAAFGSGAPRGRLNFSAWQQGVEALAWIVDAAELEQVLQRAVDFAPHVVRTAVQGGSAPSAAAQAAPGAPLLALCEGRDSAGRSALGVDWNAQPYGHHALATRVLSDEPHAGTAWQWFGSPEVLALLPFHRPQPGRSFGVVWSMPAERAAALREAPEVEFEAALQAATGGVAGRLALAGPRQSWPLINATAERVHGPGWVLLGDSAHAVHPLAGQGLNLGLGDVASLAAVLSAREPWRPLGDPKLLARHARQRWAPTRAMTGVVDGLWHLFAEPAPPVQWARNLGLSALDRFSPLKRALARQALG